MRTITDHKLNGLNDALAITVLDEPGQGGANHVYSIHAPGPIPENPGSSLDVFPTRIVFQNGPIKEAGVNGISGEALLAIVIDRLRSFQAGPYASPDNAEAMTNIQVGLECLHRRTRERLARGVEGTNAA